MDPLVHIGIFRREFVENKLIFDEDYASLVALSQVIPGPTSSQVGWVSVSILEVSKVLSRLERIYAAEFDHYGYCRSMGSTGGSFGAGWLIAAMKIVAVGVVTQALLGMWYQLCTDRETKITALIAALIFYVFPF